MSCIAWPARKIFIQYAVVTYASRACRRKQQLPSTLALLAATVTSIFMCSKIHG
jgi:hypothetical protein